jgi:hypothetical protein
LFDDHILDEARADIVDHVGWRIDLDMQGPPQGDPYGGAVGRNRFLVEHDELFP